MPRGIFHSFHLANPFLLRIPPWVTRIFYDFTAGFLFMHRLWHCATRNCKLADHPHPFFNTSGVAFFLSLASRTGGQRFHRVSKRESQQSTTWPPSDFLCVTSHGGRRYATGGSGQGLPKGRGHYTPARGFEPLAGLRLSASSPWIRL